MNGSKATFKLRTLPCAVAAAFIISTATVGCREEDPVQTGANQGSMPTMVTLDVDTYISDSGFVKYHAITDVWEMYDDTTQPYWRFPRPLIVDILDPGMKPHSHIECDSAVYQTQRRLFRFDGNVVAVNIARDTFLTPQLYWDQKTTEFYTDSFIHIVKADRILEGYGFRSNERMTRYTITRPTAILPVSAFRGEHPDSAGSRRLAASRDSADRATERAFGDASHGIPVPASQRKGPAPSDLRTNNNDYVTPRR